MLDQDLMSEQPTASKQDGTSHFKVLGLQVGVYQAGKGNLLESHFLSLQSEAQLPIISLSDCYYHQGVCEGHGMMLVSCASPSGASIIIQLNF